MTAARAMPYLPDHGQAETSGGGIFNELFIDAGLKEGGGVVL
jgi:hypothetical protein